MSSSYAALRLLGRFPLSGRTSTELTKGSEYIAMKLYKDIPAALTVAIGSFARDSKKAIKKGMRLTWFTAFNALFDVSLRQSL